MNMTPKTENYTHLENVVTMASSEQSQSSPETSRTTYTFSALRDTYAVLRTAIPSTEEVRALAKTNISYAQSEGALIEQEIVRVQQMLDKLQSRRDELRRFEDLEKGLLSPIRRIPFEILQHIFLLAHGGIGFSPQDFTAVPWVASQVCSYWRSVAHSCASVWTVISYIIDEQVEKYNTRYGKLLTHCLQLSNEMPLILQFHSSVTQEVLGDSCLQALVLSAHRWKHIHIEDNELSSALFSSIPKGSTLENLDLLNLRDLHDMTSITAAPKLTKLFLAGRYVTNQNIIIEIESAPSLVYLYIKNIHQPSVSLKGIDWSRIQKFEATEIDFEPDELITILERMPNLLSLTLDGPTKATTCITMSCLESLSVYYPEGGDIFNILTTPCLKKICVGYEVDFSSISASFVGFAHHSKFNLEELTVGTIGIDDSYLTPEFSTVKTLYMESWKSSFTSWRNIKRLKLQIRPSPNDIFPELNSLHINNLGSPTEHAENECDITTLVDMLKSRLGPQQSEIKTRTYLTSIEIHFSFTLDEKDAAILTNFVASEIVKNSGVKAFIWDRGYLRLSTSG